MTLSMNSTKRRTYLLTVIETEDFESAMAVGWEPRNTSAGDFWLKIGDWNRNAYDKPVFPAFFELERDSFENQNNKEP